ncbi:class I SAM-dependent methyltransferase [Phormidium sp. FACHB-1136]|uniref:class I SAM-dependent methyltransferase n=1 Tax=Phormidium sp. FACHB-1136 TaxID=2692848 RepID=UPI001683C42C|nr:class I SAM-dependent methyltransferase [Phormidium sp. FACHB-1136]MBD2424567.1 methyltransferase domain-containing protein [Phormidium sp. FACHB-1136]
MEKIIYASLSLVSRIFGKISRIISNAANQFEPQDIQENLVRESTQYNMVTAPDEPYYAEQYWTFIRPHLDRLSGQIQAIDLGCCQGRFTLRLAQLFPTGQVIACDLSPGAISTAKQYSQESSVTNISYRVQTVSECLKTIEPNTCDVILMTEVTFFYPEWQLDLPKIVESLKPRGILVMSFKSKYFYALMIARHRVWENVDMLINQTQGRIGRGSSVEFTWQTSTEIREILTDKFGLTLLDLVGIGVVSGMEGHDPHDNIVQPSLLNNSEREALMKLELALAPQVPDAGRYILAVARKP